MNASLVSRLRHLARLYNVQTAYYDVSHKRRQASGESLLAVLKALGAPIASPDDVGSAIRERKQALLKRVTEPVTVAWNSNYPLLKACLPQKTAESSINGHLELENGEQQDFRWQADNLKTIETMEIEGTACIVKQITLPVNLPPGYHKLRLESGSESRETLIISAPEKAYTPHEQSERRTWGVFMPLYALYAENGTGSGDYATLQTLTERIAEMGGKAVATLPILPTFLDEPYEPSPYAPVSRMLWNEFYIDVHSVPELSRSTQAKAILESAPVASEIQKLRSIPMVDYRRLMEIKRRVLEECCRYLTTEKPERFHEFREFIRAPVVSEYARFRAVMEKQHSTWPSWPEPLRNGQLNDGDYEEKTKLYYEYAQWLAHQQVKDLGDSARRHGVTLYFDLPVGTHRDGFDVWRERRNFALEASVGSPPDTVFTGGQDWLFPPLHPERMREAGYRYFRDFIRHHLSNAGMLRIDHIMGLHRLFWIPGGLDSSHGVYVRYPAEELYAILALESQRHRSVIVGEDLGTVPPYVRPAMSRHGLQRMYILHYELAGDSDKVRIPQRNTVAGLNTHDMPPFTAFWQESDIDERQRLGLTDSKGARTEKKERRNTKNTLTKFLRKKKWLHAGIADAKAAFKGCLSFLSAGPARFVLVNLEDLWSETESQNVPSTDGINPNWRRKARYSLEEFCRMPEVHDILTEVDRLRKQGRK